MTLPNQLKEKLMKLFYTQPLAVLSTHNQGQPYGSLVAFVVSEDLKQIYFATDRATNKYRNISSDHRVSILIDNRSNQPIDIHRAIAATALGVAREVPKNDNSYPLKLYLNKHPHLRDFVHDENCVLLCIEVKKYYVVDKFQQVEEFNPETYTASD